MEPIACKDEKLMWRLMTVRFDYLRINFLLERLSSERGRASKRKLLEVAREMLDLTVFLWLERDRSAGRKRDYDYIVGEQTVVYRRLTCLLTRLKLPHRLCLTACLAWEYYAQSS